MSDLAPIALFVYNRPHHTKQTIEAVLRNKIAMSSDLYIFSDAAKSELALSEVQAVREYIATVKGFKSVRIIEREKNLGLAASVIEGVTQLCMDNGRVIVLEDDLVVSPGFLDYMNRALEKYKNESRVMQISGYMFPVDIQLETDAFFLSFTSSWGWATWQRAWNAFDPEAEAFVKLQKDKKLRKLFDLDGTYPYSRMLQAQLKGSVDSWAIRWYLSVFFENGLVLYPQRSMVSNIGFDGSGTHCGVSKDNEVILNSHMLDKLPNEINVEERHKNLVYQYLNKINANNLFVRLKRKLGILFL